MANQNKTVSEHMQPYSGSFGNASVAIFKYEAAAVASGDVIYMGKLPKYAYVHNVVMYTDDLSSAGATISLGYITAEVGGSLSSATYWTTTTDVASSAARTVSAAEPKLFSEEVHVICTVGTAEVTGTIYVIVEFLYEND